MFARKHGKWTGVWGTIERMGWVFSVSLDGRVGDTKGDERERVWERVNRDVE